MKKIRKLSMFIVALFILMANFRFYNNVVSANENVLDNFVEKYGLKGPTAGKAYVDVEKDNEKLKFKIWWHESANSYSEWQMSGKLNLETLTLEYTNAKHTTRVYESKEVFLDTVEYENGTGQFIFNDQNKSLTWEDNQSDDNEGVIFYKS